jgi:hypothetical protein
MSTALTFPLMTSEQFFALPEPQGDFTYELHFGELVKVGRPKKKHFDLQSLIRDVLVKALGEQRWRIEIEMPYGLTAGFDVRAADVGVSRREVWDAVRDRKMEEDAVAHITHGASMVWLVRPDRREILAVTSASRRLYGADQQIELPSPLLAVIAVASIFPH